MAPETYILVGSVLVMLGLAFAGGVMLQRQVTWGLDPKAVEQFNLRVRAWWIIMAVLALTFLLGNHVTEIAFGILSFWALREFITLTPTRIADHRALFWVFILFLPMQYTLVILNQYELFTVVIPVYAYLFIPARIALAGDHKRYLERCAKIQAALMICVYCLSHAAVLLELRIRGYDDSRLLLFFFMLVTLSGDAFSYIFERIIGQHPIVPNINAHKTWEGVLGGIACATLFGTALYAISPFNPLEAALMSLVTSAVGFCGGMVMSAIKRDRGVHDYGTLVQGHYGVLDRIDSICFAAPVFYHFTILLLKWKEMLIA